MRLRKKPQLLYAAPAVATWSAVACSYSAPFVLLVTAAIVLGFLSWYYE